MTETPDRSPHPNTPQPPFPAPDQHGQSPYQPYSPPPGAYPPGLYQGSYPPPPMSYGDYSGGPVAPRNGLGIAALVVAIIGLIGSISVVGGILLGIVAVILGLAGRARAKRGEATNGGVALAGIVIGVVAIVAGLAFIAFWVGLFNEVGAGDYFDCLQQAGQDRTLVQQCSDQFRESVENKFTVAPSP